MRGKKVPAISAERTKTGGQTESIESDDGVSRRHALISIGKYAAYMTPAMTVLVRGDVAPAGHQCGNPGDPQVPSHSCIP